MFPLRSKKYGEGALLQLLVLLPPSAKRLVGVRVIIWGLDIECGVRVLGLGYGVWGLGFGVWGLGVEGWGLTAEGL